VADGAPRRLTDPADSTTLILCSTGLEVRMANLTLAIDNELLKRARQVALAQETTVNALVRDYLEELVSRHSYDAEKLIRELDALYARTSVKKGKRAWTREGLHER
jgi:hypothetical protein